MPSIWEHKLTVTDSEIDALGHVNNVEYVRWMQDAAIAHSTAQGWSMKRYRELGATWVARTHFIKYRRPAYEGDPILVRTWVCNLKGIASLRKYEISNASNGTILAEGETSWVFIDMKTLKPTRIPPEVAEAYEIVQQPEQSP